VLGCGQRLPKLAVTRLPSARYPVISGRRIAIRAAPAELDIAVTKTIEDGVSGVAGVQGTFHTRQRWIVVDDDSSSRWSQHRPRA